jgi:hypothetical protein
MKAFLTTVLTRQLTNPMTKWMSHQLQAGQVLLTQWFHPMEYQLAGIPIENTLENKAQEGENIFDNFLLFAVPKSKVKRIIDFHTK